MSADFTIELASLPDRECLVAEAWAGDMQVCEVAFEDGALTCVVFSQAREFGGLETMIAAAEHRLRERYDIPPATRLRIVDETSV